MESKICTSCKELKTIDNFSKRSKSKDGFKYKCKSCDKLYTIEKSETIKGYYLNKKEEISKKDSEYYIENKDYILFKSKERYDLNKDSQSLYHKEYYKINSKVIIKNGIEYKKEKYNNDLLFKLKTNIQSSLNRCLKNIDCNKSKRTQDILGIKFIELILYLENKFELWMNWENKGLYNGEFNYGWDIDHIIPLSSAKTEEELYKLCHYSNLQPLCSKINRDIKKNKLNY